MKRKPYAIVDLSTPEEVRDEAILIDAGEPRYWLLLSDTEIELLADGVVSAGTSQRAFNMLDWKRRDNRLTARALARKVKARCNSSC